MGKYCLRSGLSFSQPFLANYFIEEWPQILLILIIYNKIVIIMFLNDFINVEGVTTSTLSSAVTARQ